MIIKIMIQPTLRKASPADADLIAQIYVDSWNVGFEGLMLPRNCTPELIRRWENDLSDGFRQWWVAEIDNSIVGFVGIGPSRDPVEPNLGELDTIAVAPAWWQKKIGQLLMEKAISLFRLNGYHQAILWTLAGYERGQRFYEALGWRQDGGTRADGTQIRYCYVLE